MSETDTKISDMLYSLAGSPQLNRPPHTPPRTEAEVRATIAAEAKRLNGYKIFYSFHRPITADEIWDVISNLIKPNGAMR